MGWKLMVSGLVLVTVVPRLLSHVYSQGYHKVVQRHYPGDCHVVSGSENGSEDMEMLADDIALISSGLRYATSRDNPFYQGREGQILMFDFNSPENVAIPLHIEGDFNVKEFNAHGLSVYNDDTGVSYVYVINHLGDFEVSVVEKFLVDLVNKKLTHLKTLDTNFHVLNDLALVGEDKFYFTNYYYFRRSTFENILHPKWASIGYFDGENGHIAVPNLFKPNGLVASRNHRTLYVANFFDMSISVYEVLARGSLQLSQTIELNASPDNIVIDEDGDDITLYAGCMPVPWKTRAFIHDPEHYNAPSQVLRVRLRPNSSPDVVELFSDDGKRISASSSGMVHRSQLLIGSVASHALVCDVKYEG